MGPHNRGIVTNMENSYGIGVANRYELFYDEDVDPMDLISQAKVETEKENKAKGGVKTVKGPAGKKAVKTEVNNKIAEKTDTFSNAGRGGRGGPDNRVKFSDREERNNRRNRPEGEGFRQPGEFRQGGDFKQGGGEFRDGGERQAPRFDGVFIVVGSGTGPATLPTGPATLPTGPATGPGQEQTVTETAAHVTRTIRQPVTLIKTRTVDRYTTITSPVYNNAVATVTNFVKQTVGVPENQVIRSTVAGGVVVNTVPVVTQVVLTVTDTVKQFFVRTALDTVTSTLQHLAPNFNFRTVTVNNPQTSTVVQHITRTNVASQYVTNTVARTIYSTATVTFTVTDSINNPGGY